MSTHQMCDIVTSSIHVLNLHRPHPNHLSISYTQPSIVSPVMPITTLTKRARIKELHSDGKENIEIAERAHVHPSTVGRVLKRIDNNPNPYYQAPRGHTKCKTNERDMHHSEYLLKTGRPDDD